MTDDLAFRLRKCTFMHLSEKYNADIHTRFKIVDISSIPLAIDLHLLHEPEQESIKIPLKGSYDMLADSEPKMH